MYLLDTDIVTNPLKAKPCPGVLVRLAPLTQMEQNISAVTVAEIVFGAHRGPHTGLHLRNLEHGILPRVQVLDFDEQAARVCGELRAQLLQAGLPLAMPDLMIAATAISRGLILVTGNVRHFQRISGLRIENWLTG